MGMALARMAGLKTGIITGRMSEMVRRRAEELKVDAVVQGQINKLAAYDDIKARFNLADADIAFIGDDLVDLCILKRAGFSAAVADARQASQERQRLRDRRRRRPGGRARGGGLDPRESGQAGRPGGAVLTMTGRGSVLEQLRADVSLTGAGQDGDDRLAARFRSRGDFQGGPNGGTRRDPAKNTFGFGQESGGFEGVLVCHLHDIVEGPSKK
jgi:YrbI family 3-deoxy-D-manno-octulosonate 8-phosphate phosphatase